MRSDNPKKMLVIFFFGKLRVEFVKGVECFGMYPNTVEW